MPTSPGAAADSEPRAANNGETHSRAYGLSLAQPIFRGFRTLNAVRIAEANVRAGRETLRNAEQTVLLGAVTAYMDVVRDQAVVRLNENNVNVLSNQLKATQDQFSVGEVTRTDVAQAEARRAGSQANLEVARANLKASRADLRAHRRQPARAVCRSERADQAAAADYGGGDPGRRA